MEHVVLLVSTTCLLLVLTARRVQPNVMYDTSHPAHAHLQKIGREITSSGVRTGHGNDTSKLQAVVVFSAHWQAREPGTIEINVAEQADLIYEWVSLHFLMLSSLGSYTLVLASRSAARAVADQSLPDVEPQPEASTDSQRISTPRSFPTSEVKRWQAGSRAC